MNPVFFLGLACGVPLGASLLYTFWSLMPQRDPLEVTGTVFAEVSLPPDYIVGEQTEELFRNLS